MADLFKILLAEKLGHCDSLYESVIGKKLGGYSWLSDYETTPYLYRAMPNMSHYYNREIMEEVVGASVGWNQQYDKSYPTSQTVEGVTFTVNSDGTITLNGAQAGVRDIYYQITPKKSFNNHKLLLMGCPQNGGKYTYRMYMDGHGAESYDIGEGAIFAQTVADKAVYIYIDASYTTTISNLTFKPQLTDLTLALGSTIADYVYSLETATTGSGVAWLKQHFPKMCQYNPYDAGSIQSVSGLVSHDMVGFNAWDEEWEKGYLDPSTGNNASSNDCIRSKNYSAIFPNTTYYVKVPNSSGVNCKLYFYDEDKAFISWTTKSNETHTTPSNARYLRFYMSNQYGTTYNHDICINLSDASRNGQYEPYRKSSYPLDSTLTLRGIPKLDNGKLYYDGDTYGADGSVSRKYGVVDLGTLNWQYASGAFLNDTSVTDLHTKQRGADCVCARYVSSGSESASDMADKSIQIMGGVGGYNVWVKDSAYTYATAFKTAMSGVYLVYPLATPTTETATPFTKTQLCDSGGTEEFVATGVNVWDEVSESGYISIADGTDQSGSAYARSKNYSKCLPNTSYYFRSSASQETSAILWYDADKNYISGVGAKNETVTSPSNAYYFRIYYDVSTYNHDISINYPSTDTAYHPYGCLVSVGHKSKYAEK